MDLLLKDLSTRLMRLWQEWATAQGLSTEEAVEWLIYKQLVRDKYLVYRKGVVKDVIRKHVARRSSSQHSAQAGYGRNGSQGENQATSTAADIDSSGSGEESGASDAISGDEGDSAAVSGTGQ